MELEGLESRETPNLKVQRHIAGLDLETSWLEHGA